MQADATTRQRIRRLRRLDPGAHLVLTGCSVDANPGAYTTVDSVFANPDKDSIAAHVLAMSRRDEPPRDAPLHALARIHQGAGRMRPSLHVLHRVAGARHVVERPRAHRARSSPRRASTPATAEIVLCGVDLGSYGRDIGTDLATLVASLLERAARRARIRLSSINANDVSPALIALNAHPRLCSHWHMPLQSGSDRVLRAMHRGYRRAQYLRVAHALREANPLTEFTTDIMVAIPRRDRGRPCGDAVTGRRGGVPPGSRLPLVAAPRDAGIRDRRSRVDDAAARRRSAEVRRATQALRRGVARPRVRASARGRVGRGRRATSAHGLTAGYHEVIVEGATDVRQGGLDLVRAETVEGDRLRGTLLRS